MYKSGSAFTGKVQAEVVPVPIDTQNQDIAMFAPSGVPPLSPGGLPGGKNANGVIPGAINISHLVLVARTQKYFQKSS